MTTTCLPAAVMNPSSGMASPSHRLFERVRYSMAKWMPPSSRPGTGRLGRDPAALERALDDRHLDRLDRHRIVVDPEHARAFARSGAEPARPLREIVRRLQALDGLLPLIAVHEVVPVRDDVAERT